MTKGRKHENTDGTLDIGDYVKSILEDSQTPCSEVFGLTHVSEGQFLMRLENKLSLIKLFYFWT